MKIKVFTLKILTIIIALIVISATILPCSISSQAADGNLVIMLDPGHGGIDGGAERTFHGVYYNENNLMLKVANYAKAELSQYPGVTVLMTRENTTTTLTLAERVSKATANGAHAVISIHANAHSDTSVGGAEALVASGNFRPEIANATKNIGTKILEQLANIGIKNRGIKIRLDNQDKIIEYYPDGSLQDYYGIVQRSLRGGIPGVIIETAFISNESDVINHFSTETKLQEVGKAIATGIAKHYGLSKSTAATAAIRPHIDARALVFSGNPDTSFLYPLNGTSVSQSTGCATLTAGSSGIKTYIDYRGMSFSADTYKYAVIRMRSTVSDATAIINTGAHKITYDTPEFTYKATLGTDFKNIIIDMSDKESWTLAVNFIKIQISGTSTADIEYIRFYESKSAIENGVNASKPSAIPTTKPTVPPTAKPTATPTKDPVIIPTTTVSPALTNSPVASESTTIPASDNNLTTPDNIQTSPLATDPNSATTPDTHEENTKNNYNRLIVLICLLVLTIVANIAIVYLKKRHNQ